MRHQQPPPAVVALTALLATMTGLLATWALHYAHIPLIPRLIFAGIAALTMTAISAKVYAVPFSVMFVEVALLTTIATARTIQVLAGAALRLLGDLQLWLQRARANQQITYTTAA